MSSIIGFANEALFFTNIWVFLYTNLLSFLNKRLPPIPIQEKFIRPDYKPEPYEIPLFLLLSIVFTLIIFLYYRYVKKYFSHKIAITLPYKYSVLIKSLVFIALGKLLFDNLGRYPLAHDLFPYSLGLYPYPDIKETPVTYHIYLFFYLASIAFIIVQTAILNPILKQSKKLFVIFMIFLLGILSLVMFEPQFPSVGHDYTFIIGPIWEIAHGKTIFTPNPSFYGFVSILLLSFLYKIHLLNLWYLPAVNWLLYVVQYSLCFYLIYRISRSLIFSVLGVISLLTVSYFSLFHMPAVYPQTGLLRWFGLLFSLILLYKLKKFESKRFTFLIALLSFWTIDSGISLLLAYGFTLCLLMISKKVKWIKGVQTFLFLAISIILIFSLIQLLHFIFGYQFIDISLIFVKLTQFSKAGFGMLPIAPKSYFWIVLLVYFASIIYFFRKQNHIILFSANISLFSSIYYVGRSHEHNLFHIALLGMLNLFLLLGLHYKQITSFKLKFILCVIFYLIFIVFPAYERQEMITRMFKEKIQRLRSGNIFIPEAKRILEQKYQKEVEMIKKIPQKQVVILSDDDTYLLYMTGKESFIDYNPQIVNIAESDLDLSLRRVIDSCPKTIVGDCRLFGKCSSSDPYSLSYLFIQPILLQKIQQACQNTYEATTCTEHLCVAISK